MVVILYNYILSVTHNSLRHFAHTPAVEDLYKPRRYQPETKTTTLSVREEGYIFYKIWFILKAWTPPDRALEPLRGMAMPLSLGSTRQGHPNDARLQVRRLRTGRSDKQYLFRT